MFSQLHTHPSMHSTSPPTVSSQQGYTSTVSSAEQAANLGALLQALQNALKKTSAPNNAPVTAIGNFSAISSDDSQTATPILAPATAHSSSSGYVTRCGMQDTVRRSSTMETAPVPSVRMPTLLPVLLNDDVTLPPTPPAQPEVPQRASSSSSNRVVDDVKRKIRRGMARKDIAYTVHIAIRNRLKYTTSKDTPCSDREWDSAVKLLNMLVNDYTVVPMDATLFMFINKAPCSEAVMSVLRCMERLGITNTRLAAAASRAFTKFGELEKANDMTYIALQWGSAEVMDKAGSPEKKKPELPSDPRTANLTTMHEIKSSRKQNASASVSSAPSARPT